jgi:hypothetical protein
MSIEGQPSDAARDQSLAADAGVACTAGFRRPLAVDLTSEGGDAPFEAERPRRVDVTRVLDSSKGLGDTTAVESS